MWPVCHFGPWEYGLPSREYQIVDIDGLLWDVQSTEPVALGKFTGEYAGPVASAGGGKSLSPHPSEDCALGAWCDEDPHLVGLDC